jgi:hypothetical protein
MAISVRLDDKFVETAQLHAEATKRTVPKQIEYWAEIGRISEENPDLSYEFIKTALLASAQLSSGNVSKYVRRNKSK